MTETDRQIACPVAEAALTDPDRPAVVAGDRSLSYNQLDRTLSVVVRQLRMKGVDATTRVAAHLFDDWGYPILVWALLRIGAPLVPLSTREPLERLRAQAELAGCQYCVRDAPGPAICEVDVSLSSLSGASTGEPERRDVPGGPARLMLQRPATVVFTSGSTGESKGVLLTLENHWYSALGSQSSIPVDMRTRWMVVLPFYHVGGLSILFRCFSHGGCVAIGGPGPIAASLRAMRPTHISLVPTQLVRLIDRDEASLLAELRCVLVGGSRIPSSLIERARSAGVPIRKTYGLTEMASQVSTTPEDPTPDDLATSGVVLPHREVRIAEDGEVLVRGRTRFSGYVTRQGLSRPFERDGWFATGDVGRLDDQDRLIVVGRKDGMFVSGGENVYPEEIEEAILNTGLIDRVAVVSVDDEEFGARPVAFVSPVTDIQALRDALRSRIAAFKIPDRFLELPDPGGLPIDRALLKELSSRQGGEL